MAPRRRTAHARRRRTRDAREAASKDLKENARDSAVPGGRAIMSQRRRERKLRCDPLATILDPQNVLCNRCGTQIKLSVKSAFDDFHWKRHRDRCLRRSDATVAELRESNGNAEEVDMDDDEVSVPDDEHTSRDATTPPLTEDGEEGRRSTTVELPSPAPASPASSSGSTYISPRVARSCEISSQAYDRWHSYYTRPRDDPEGDADYDLPRITYKESQLRSTQDEDC